MFVERSQAITGFPHGPFTGLAAADWDGDGAIEVFVANEAGPNRVLKWVGGKVRDIAPPILADQARAAVAVAAADYDGDGREELYVATSHEAGDRLFDRDAAGRWHDQFAEPARLPEDRKSSQVAAIDRRGTGRYGFVVSQNNRPLRLYELSPDGHLADRAPGLGLARDTRGHGLWVGPLVSDRSDLVVVARRPNAVFVNRGDGLFDDRAAISRLGDAEETGRAVTAVDCAGRLGLVVVNQEGPHRLFVRELDGRYRDRASPALAFPGATTAVVAADFDNDGFEELFFLNDGEPNRLFGQRPEWRLLDPGPATDPYGLVASAIVVDLDADGTLELLVSRGLRLFKVPNDHGWLRIAPRTRFGAPARGSLVTLTAGGRTQVRVIDGGGHEPVAHFGLGRVDRVEQLTITWPDGASRLISDPVIRRTITVEYPAG